MPFLKIEKKEIGGISVQFQCLFFGQQFLTVLQAEGVFESTSQRIDAVFVLTVDVIVQYIVILFAVEFFVEGFQIVHSTCRKLGVTYRLS